MVLRQEEIREMGLQIRRKIALEGAQVRRLPRERRLRQRRILLSRCRHHRAEPLHFCKRRSAAVISDHVAAIQRLINLLRQRL